MAAYTTAQRVVHYSEAEIGYNQSVFVVVQERHESRRVALGDIADAIHLQESGGAAHDYQIQPATFRRYARGGERYSNPRAHDRVYSRILTDLYERAGGDPARIAVGYFSGPSNISRPGSRLPYIRDTCDRNGKRVSSYVADIMDKLYE